MGEFSTKSPELTIELKENKQISQPFSEAAASLIREKSTEYFNELINESIVVGKRDQADIISSKHVQIASNNLISHSQGRLYQHLGTWGGIFLGTSLSSLMSMLLVNQYPPIGVVAVTVIGTVGSYLLGKSLST